MVNPDELDEHGCITIDDEWDHENTSEIVCPHCGYVVSDSLEWGDGNDDIDACPHCERKFKWNSEMDVSYSTEKIDWLKEWSWKNRRKIIDRETRENWFNDRFEQLEHDYGLIERHFIDRFLLVMSISNNLNAAEDDDPLHKALTDQLDCAIYELNACSEARIEKVTEIDKLVAKYK